MKKLFISTFILILMGFGCNSNQGKIINEQQIKIDELTKKIDALVSEASTTKAEIAKTKSVTSKENLDTVLLNYKVDSQDNDRLIDLVFNAANNSPNDLCPNIILSASTKDNAYYMLVKAIGELERKYGKYKVKIEYINNNLSGKWDILSFVKERCSEVGYQIP